MDICIPQYSRSKNEQSFIDFDETCIRTVDFLNNLPLSIPKANKISSEIQKLGVGNGSFKMTYDTYGEDTLLRIIKMTKEIFVESVRNEMQVGDSYTLTGSGFPECQSLRLHNVFSPEQSYTIVPAQADKIRFVSRYLRHQFQKKVIPKEILLFDDRLFGDENVYPISALQELEKQFDVRFQVVGVKNLSEGNTHLVDLYSS